PRRLPGHGQPRALGPRRRSGGTALDVVGTPRGSGTMTLDTIDVYERTNYIDAVPHEMFARLRREAPVFWHPEPDGPGFWAVTQHADVVEVNRDWERFSSNKGGVALDDMAPETLA